MHRDGCFSSQFTSEEKRKKENSSKKSEKNLKYFLIFQVYPDKDINNIVESNHYTKISGWCKLGRTKCKGPARWVKPYRCLGMLYFCSILIIYTCKATLLQFSLKIAHIFMHHSGPDNLKKSRPKNSWNQISKSFFFREIFGSFKLFLSSKIDFFDFTSIWPRLF